MDGYKIQLCTSFPVKWNKIYVNIAIYLIHNEHFEVSRIEFPLQEEVLEKTLSV